MAQRRNLLFIVLFAGALFISFCLVMVYLFSAAFINTDMAIGKAVAVVDITGEIFYDRAKIREIEEYRDNDNIKAVVLFINSPGGGVAASQELYHAVMDLRAAKPVVASMGEIAASGGYYVACAADSIVALEGTITGSIGVIATFLRTEELYHKIGLEVTVLKSGKYKDIGSPHREMSPDEKEYMGALLDRVYDQFIEAVSEGRGMDRERVRTLAEGRLYSGAEAQEAGLVDRIGTFDDAVTLAAAMGGIEGEPKIVKKRKRRPLLDRIMGERISGLALGQPQRGMTLKYIVP